MNRGPGFRRPWLAGSLLAAAVLLSGCATEAADEPAQDMQLSSFSSADELLAAVNGLHGCDPDTTAEPVTIVFDGYQPQYAMCSEALQVVRYENEEDRITVSDMLPNGQNAPTGIAEGANWHVLPLPGTAAPDEKEMKDLAYQLGGRYMELTEEG